MNTDRPTVIDSTPPLPPAGPDWSRSSLLTGAQYFAWVRMQEAQRALGIMPRKESSL